MVGCSDIKWCVGLVSAVVDFYLFDVTVIAVVLSSEISLLFLLLVLYLEALLIYLMLFLFKLLLYWLFLFLFILFDLVLKITKTSC